MPANYDHDLIARGRLTAVGKDLAELDEWVAAAAAGSAPLPWPLPEIFVRLATAAEICEKTVEDHASANARVSDDTLREVAANLRLVREVTTGLLQIALTATTRPSRT